jgi:glycogen debranching enzyme
LWVRGDLWSAAAAVLRANDRVTHTVPSPRLYPHQWAWDSAFAAIGWAHLDPARAVTELRTLLAGAWSDGRVPHIRFSGGGAYFPGPEAWGAGGSTTISQPPVWASAARRVAEVTGTTEAVADLLPAIEASHRFFELARDPLEWGAVAVVHPWESGMDNAPQWDEPLADVDPTLAPRFVRTDVDEVDDPDQRPTDDQYARFMSIVTQLGRGGNGPGPFVVYDPFITSILARAESDLAVLARESGDSDRAVRADARSARLIEGLMSRLWDEPTGRFAYHDVPADRRLLPNVIGAYGPLMLTDDLPSSVGATLGACLLRHYVTPWPLPTTAPSDPGFDAHRYWRGPTWVNVNWLLAPHVDLDLAERSLELLRRQGFREYFDPVSGEGLGARSFTWSAALALDWLAAG